MKPQRNHGAPLSQLARLRVSSPMAKGGLRIRIGNTRVLGPPHASATLPLLRSPSSPAHVITDIEAGRTLIKPNGNNRTHTNTLRASNHQAHHPHPLPEPSSLHTLHSGLFSSSTTGSDIRKWEASSLPLPYRLYPESQYSQYPLFSTSPRSAHSGSGSSLHSPSSSIGQSSISPTLPSYPISPRCFLILPRRPSPRRPMAFSTYSTASSDISTPRSISPPSSIISARSSHSSVSSKRLSLSLQRRQSALNPMSSVDISAIEQQMKMASLDGLRGYAQNHYGEVHQYRSTDYVPQSAAGGYQVLREPLWNKGTSGLTHLQTYIPTNSIPNHQITNIYIVDKVSLLPLRSVYPRT